MTRMSLLLVDDNPVWLDRGVVRLDPPYDEYFELMWIPNAAQGRWLLDACELLMVRYPHDLGEIGLPPELIIFDYALSQPVMVRSDGDSSICDRVLAVARRLGLPLSPPPRDSAGVPTTGAELGKDRMGCFVGGEMARAFSAHPCGAVPTTAHVDTSATDTAFYEWLNQRTFGDLFASKTRPSPTWRDLIGTGAAVLRARTLDLLRAGIVQVSVVDLMALAAAPPDMTRRELRIFSRYGARTWAIPALFADVAFGVASEERFRAVVRDFAGEALMAICGATRLTALQEARALAESYFEAWASPQVVDRAELCRLIMMPTRRPEDDERLTELCRLYGTDRDQPPDRATVAMHTLPPLYRTSDDPSIVRWAVLFLAVLVEKYLVYGKEAFLRWRATLTSDQLSAGQIDAAEMEKRIGPAQWEKLKDDLQLKETAERLIDIRLPLRRHAEVSDLVQAVDPLPVSLLTIAHRGRNAATAVTNALKRLGHGSTWGSLSLNVSDVLENRPFRCGACAEAASTGSVDPPHLPEVPSAHGLRPGEGLVLQTYALECGFVEDYWPLWLVHAP